MFLAHCDTLKKSMSICCSGSGLSLCVKVDDLQFSACGGSGKKMTYLSRLMDLRSDHDLI